MIKDVLNSNEKIGLSHKELSVLKETFPACFGPDGSFDIVRFKEYLSDKINVTNEGYELRFLGKNYARLLASLDTTTVIVPDQEHNNKPENKDSQNIYIRGDNLDGLKHLLKTYSGKVRCIYIDPPYNTGDDGFVYNDSFNFTVDDIVEKLSISEEQAQRILDLTKRGSASHSAWLVFMYSRLLLARDLLSSDGLIFISIDDNEQSNCKLLCDDVFGENNFLTCISRATGTPTGGGFDGLVNEMDYILVYARNIAEAVMNKLDMTEEDAEIYNEVDKNGNRFLSRSLRRTGGENRREDRPTMFYPLIDPDGNEVYPIGPTGYESRWICEKETAKRLEESGLIIWKKKKLLGETVWHPYQIFYLDNRAKTPGNIWKDIIDEDDKNPLLWDDVEGNKKATRDIRDLFDGYKVFETAKPIGLIDKIITIGSKQDDVIVDFFSGAATTAAAVMEHNCKNSSSHRKFLLIQLPEPVKKGSDAEKYGFKTVDEIGYQRILKTSEVLHNEFPNANVDLGFRCYNLKEPSAQTLDSIEEFNPAVDSLFKETILNEFGFPTILSTWLVRDGYGFTSLVESVDFNGYTGYYIDKHLYLINPGLKNETIASITEKIESEGAFNPENVVLFGYSFLWTEIEALKNNLARLRDSEKNLRINFDLRY